MGRAEELRSLGTEERGDFEDAVQNVHGAGECLPSGETAGDDEAAETGGGGGFEASRRVFDRDTEVCAAAASLDGLLVGVGTRFRSWTVIRGDDEVEVLQ